MKCQLCQREIRTTRHHLIPKSRHNKKRKKKYGDAIRETINICADCHSNIHATFTLTELADKYNTLENLANHTDIHKFSKWARKQNIKKRFRSKKTKR